MIFMPYEILLLLLFDKILSRLHSMSCAQCEVQARLFDALNHQTQGKVDVAA